MHQKFKNLAKILSKTEELDEQTILNKTNSLPEHYSQNIKKRDSLRINGCKRENFA